MKQGYISLLNYEVPLILTNEEINKKNYACTVEFSFSTLHYIILQQDGIQKCYLHQYALEGIPFYASEEVVIKPSSTEKKRL